MKRILFILITGMWLMQSCSYHYYYGTDAPGPAGHKKAKQQTAGKAAFNYDSGKPDIKPPVLKKESKNYNPTDYSTFPVYSELHTVAEPVSEGPYDKYAIWCTKEGTYLARIEKMMWNERFFHMSSKTFLRDSHSGKMYQLRELWGLPTDRVYWMNSVAGEWFCTVYEFPPLDSDCSHIDIVYSYAERLKQVNGATGWGRDKDEINLSVTQLQAAQPKMKYKKTVIVE